MVMIKTTDEIIKDYVENWFPINKKYINWVSEEEIRKVIKDYKNPYPKDIFVWDNKEELNFNRGRFNEFIHKIVENVREDILSVLFEDEKE